MRAFRRRRGYYVADLEGEEATILSRVVADTALLLGQRLDQRAQSEDAQDPLQALSWPSDGVAAPTDPALARLLPDASGDDEELNAEFRRLTESDLRRSKVDRLRMVWEALQHGEGQLRVPEQHAMDWAAALNDVRLVLSERLEIRTEADAEALQRRSAGNPEGTDDEVRQGLGMVYSALSWLQESLLQVMLPTLEP